MTWGNRRGIIPAYKRYEGIWNWDSAFHALAVSRWDPELAREQISIIWDLQQPDGSLPDVIWSDGRLVKEFGKPPVMPWAISIVDLRDPNDAFLEALYPKLVRYEQHWRINRGGDRDGLFHYGGENPEYESGWDDAVRWDDGCSRLWCIDLNVFMVMLYDAMVYCAGRLGEECSVWHSGRAELTQAIEDRLWNDEAGAYMDFNFEKGSFTGVLTPASFLPLFAGGFDDMRAQKMAIHAADPAKFLPGMPTVAYDDPRYSDDYMRGPTWFHAMVFAVYGLQQRGYVDTANKVRETVLRWVYDGGYPYEFYDSKTGAPGKGAAFRFGWTAAFTIELLLSW